MSLGFIGCGNMASAIICGIIDSNAIKENEVYVYDTFKQATDNMKDKYNINVCANANDVVKKCDAVILAVKPNVLETVLKDINSTLTEKDTLLISIAAGKSTGFLSDCLTTNTRIIRVMPNINAKVKAAICAYTANEYATYKDKNFCEEIFSSIGDIIYLEENYFPLFGVLGGCTPALAYMFIDELARAGVKNGMKKDVALKISAQAVLGSAKMILESNEHPYDLIDKVCSPNGTTIEAVTSLQEDGFEAAIHKAVDKAIQKDKLL